MPVSENVAVIDVGSNSIKLLIAGPGKGRDRLETVFAETIETRISQGISGELPSLTDKAMQAGLETICELVRLAQEYHPRATSIVATSAVRDALNGMDFSAMVYEATGMEMQVLSGKEEASLIGKGLRCEPQIAGIHKFIQMDIGGGSLELIRFEHDQIIQALSLQLGAVRLTERFVADKDAAIDQATEAAIREHVQAAITQSGFNFAPNSMPFIATGGAFTVTRAVLATQAGTTLENFSPVLDRMQIQQLKNKVMALPLHERMCIPHLPASRADIIPSALITIEQVMQLSQRSEIIHSLFNLRYGVAAELLRK